MKKALSYLIILVLLSISLAMTLMGGYLVADMGVVGAFFFGLLEKFFQAPGFLASAFMERLQTQKLLFDRAFLFRGNDPLLI